jgi:hypothetical protein
VAQAAREAAQQPGQKAEYYCVRAASKSVAIPQYGLGQGSLGHKQGMPTLAASVANVQPGSWAGAFRLREGTWVIVIRDDLVAPDGDYLFDSDDLARERLLQEVSLGGVQRIYAPDGWAIPGSDPTPLPLLLQDRADCPLQTVQIPVKLIMYGVGGLAVVAMIIFAALQWQSERERLAEQLAEAAARATSRGPITSLVEEWKWPPAEEIYERKWEKRVIPKSDIDSCQSLLTRSHAMEYGWKLTEASCKEGALSVSRSREDEGGAAVYDSTDSNATVSDEARTLLKNYFGEKLQPRGAENLLSKKQMSQILLQRGWPFLFTRLPDDEPTVRPPSNVENPPPPPPSPWIKRGGVYNGDAAPWDLMWYFDGVPGVIIENIGYDGKSWNMEVTIYEMRGG